MNKKGMTVVIVNRNGEAVDRKRFFALTKAEKWVAENYPDEFLERKGYSIQVFCD